MTLELQAKAREGELLLRSLDEQAAQIAEQQANVSDQLDTLTEELGAAMLEDDAERVRSVEAAISTARSLAGNFAQRLTALKGKRAAVQASADAAALELARAQLADLEAAVVPQIDRYRAALDAAAVEGRKMIDISNVAGRIVARHRQELSGRWTSRSQASELQPLLNLIDHMYTIADLIRRWEEKHAAQD